PGKDNSSFHVTFKDPEWGLRYGTRGEEITITDLSSNGLETNDLVEGRSVICFKILNNSSGLNLEKD
ncbi:MAG: hypothetical protein LAT84_08295, partial [Balneolia bacterium]|nr:hypothetical protein [Balneolia bacterium]